MKKILAAILAGVMVLSLSACDEGDYSSNVDSSADSSSDFLDDIYNKLDGLTGDSDDTSSKVFGLIDQFLGSEDNNSDESASSESTGIPFTIAGVELSIPSYYTEGESSSEKTYFGYTDETQTIILCVCVLEEDIFMSEEEFIENKDSYIDTFLGEPGEVGVLNPKDILLAGLPGKSFIATAAPDDGTVKSVYVLYAYNAKAGKMIGIMMRLLRPDLLSDYLSYIEDYEKMIETAKLVTDDMAGQAGNESTEEQFDIDKDLVVAMCERDDKYTSMYNIVFAEYNEDGVPINFYAFDSYDGCINPRTMGKNFNAIGDLPSWFYVGATVHVKANLSGNGLSTLDCSVIPG